MNMVLREYLDHCVIVYLDDILIYGGDTPEEHAQRVEAILEKLRQAKLYINQRKCAWFQQEVSFLGHRVGPDGVRMEDDKVKSILEWPTPKGASDILSFIGLARYYRNYIHRFAHIAAPMTDLTKKGVPFMWGPEQEKAFQDLKTAVTTAPVLIYDQTQRNPSS